MAGQWIDVGSATCEAGDVESVTDTRPGHGQGLAKGMKSIVTLRSGRWFYARYSRRVILARVRAALTTDTD